MCFGRCHFQRLIFCTIHVRARCTLELKVPVRYGEFQPRGGRELWDLASNQQRLLRHGFRFIEAEHEMQWNAGHFFAINGCFETLVYFRYNYILQLGILMQPWSMQLASHRLLRMRWMRPSTSSMVNIWSCRFALHVQYDLHSPPDDIPLLMIVLNHPESI